MKHLLISEEELKGILLEERESLLSQIAALISKSLVKTEKKLTAKEAAVFLGISLSTLYKRVQELPHKKFGKKLIFSTTELEKFDPLSLQQN